MSQSEIGAADWARSHGASEYVAAIVDGQDEAGARTVATLTDALAAVIVIACREVEHYEASGKPRPEAQCEAVRLHALASLRLLSGD